MINYNYDDIINSNLSKEQKLAAIKQRGLQNQKEINKQAAKDYARIGIGGLLQGASMHPVFNIPYIGTGLGGALFETGAGLVDNNSLKDVAKRAGQGFVVGETVGAIPYVGKAAAKTKAGKAVTKTASNVAKNFNNTNVGKQFQKAAAKAEDVLMSEFAPIKNFNKQTAYHGSPYDFNKFSNEAIGTGEGAQAHGMGHYAALNKDVADIKYRQRGVLNKQLQNGDLADIPYYAKNSFYAEDDIVNGANKAKNYLNQEMAKTYDINETEELLNAYNKIDNFMQNFDNKGQLYKLSVPKDDVMLREGLPFSEQPKAVQEAMRTLANDYKEIGYGDLLDSIGYDEKGDSFYRLYSRLAGNGGNAARELSDRGIKGISYNGGIDGEARVIFNPDDINIVRKYYNQPSLADALRGKVNTGALADYLTNDSF